MRKRLFEKEGTRKRRFLYRTIIVSWIDECVPACTHFRTLLPNPGSHKPVKSDARSFTCEDLLDNITRFNFGKSLRARSLCVTNDVCAMRANRASKCISLAFRVCYLLPEQLNRFVCDLMYRMHAFAQRAVCICTYIVILLSITAFKRERNTRIVTRDYRERT